MILAALVLVAGLAGAHGGSYLLTSPTNLQRGLMYDLNVDILNTTGVDVKIEIQDFVYNGTTRRDDIHVLVAANGTFGKDRSGVLSVPISEDFNCQRCRVHVRGTGSLQFERASFISLRTQTVSVLIQTDKATYKPGEKVRFRAFGIFPSLLLYTGDINVVIKDPRGNKVKVLNNLNSPSGVVTGELKLSEQPLFGSWSIHVSLEEFSDYGTQNFEVRQYELPRFEVNVDLSPYGLLSETRLDGKVKAEYTFGQPVKGLVELRVGPNSGPDSCGKEPSTVQLSFDIDGEASFSIPRSDIQRVTSVYDGSIVKVTAFVKEQTTGVRLKGSSTIQYHNNKFSIDFLENTPSVFKPGLPYTAFVQASTPDGMPPADNEDRNILVYTEAKYYYTVPDQTYYSSGSFSGTFPLPGKNMTLPENGVLPIDMDIPSNATSITIKVTYQGRVATKTIEKTHSQSNNFLQLSLLGKNIQSGDTASFKLQATEEMGTITYQILSRSVVVWSQTVNMNAENGTLRVQISPDMAPTAHLLAYYVRPDFEVVADSLAFNVDGIFHNEVDIKFSINESEPHKDVYLEVSAQPGSEVNLLAVDQSVLLLKTGNDITTDKVNEKMSSYDTGKKPKDSEFALSYSSRSVREVFEETGLNVFTDVEMSAPTLHPVMYPGQPGRFRPTFQGMKHKLDNKPNMDVSNQELKEVDRVRTDFPEAWLWASYNISASGEAKVHTKVPDTITSWIASAFATHSRFGLGVSPTTAKIRVFRPFFVSLSYPREVTRGEKAVIQATVFNYLPTDQQVTVTFKPTSLYRNIEIAADGSESTSTTRTQVMINVASDKQGVVYFPIQADSIGVAQVLVKAQSTSAADAVQRFITIKAEGAPVSYNIPNFINLDASVTSYTDAVDFSLPSAVVPGSERTKVKVTGDLIGATLENLNSLISLPTGCGEQSMVKFAPDLYVAQYLKTTHQLTERQEKRINTLLNSGYQRQLTYQRNDNSFSAFGNFDEAGSTWLTAFVTRTFNDARDFIYVDPNILINAVNWLISRQLRDGSFVELGRVLDQNTQSIKSGPAITAYVVLALLKSENLIDRLACYNNHIDCHNVYKWGNATGNAISYLEEQISQTEDKFTLALISYALGEAKNNNADAAFIKLKSKAETQGAFMFWSKTIQVSVPVNPLNKIWSPPVVQARPIDVLITSYALLSFVSLGKVEEALPLLTWLTKQRNSRGGFLSTQDTSVALEALSRYASATIRNNTNLNIGVTSGNGENLNFTVTTNNALSLQVKEAQTFSTKMDIQATGTGFALAEVEYLFNVKDEISTPSFDVSTVLLDDTLNSFNLMICTKWLWDRRTGMVVQEIGVPSGFAPELSSLSSVVGMKKSEMRGSTIALYFDEIGQTSTCYSLKMVRKAKVASTTKSFIRTYDYYEPGDQATVFYQPKKLRESTICDVCRECCA